jgi:curli biogenesis system outer membrane secretion channel CsgG
MRASRLLVTSIAVLLAAGCAGTDGGRHFSNTAARANVYVAPAADVAAIRKVAVLPFKGPTELIGTSVSDLFVTELLRTARYELVERGQMARVLSETELALAGLSAARAVSVGAMMGADGVVIGTVDEYGAAAARGHAYPVVGISARLIDCRTGKIVWSVDEAGKAKSKALTLPEQARKVVHDMVATLYRSW